MVQSEKKHHTLLVMDKERGSEKSTTEHQHIEINSLSPEAFPSSDKRQHESTQPEKHSLKENAMSCQVQLTELLRVIANNKRSSNKMVSDRDANPGPSGDSCKPLRKAKHSWQVKNLSGHSQSTPINEGGLLGQELQGIKDAGAGDFTEPPQKKPKLSEDIPSTISLETDVKYTTTNFESQSSCRSPTYLGEASTSSEGITGLDGKKGPVGGCENISEEDSRKASTSNTSPGQVQRVPSSRSSSVLAKWQSKHIAQSIVDNAINATLEVLGFSLAVGVHHPGQAIMAAAEAARGRTLEEDAVSAVIRARGLQGTEQVCSARGDEPRHVPGVSHEVEDHLQDERTPSHGQSYAIQSAAHMNPLDPLLGRLTHFTETMSTADHIPTTSPANEGNTENQKETNAISSVESSIDLDNLLSPSLQTDVLNKAVCAAISQKGLAMDEDL